MYGSSTFIYLNTIISYIIYILIISIFFARQGLSGPYQMSEKKKKKKIIGNFTILTQLCDLLLCFDLFLNERFSDVTLDRA